MFDLIAMFAMLYVAPIIFIVWNVRQNDKMNICSVGRNDDWSVRASMWAPSAFRNES